VSIRKASVLRIAKVLGRGILVVVVGLVASSAMLDWPAPPKHWRHPVSFRAGVQEARKAIAQGTAFIFGPGCVISGIPRQDEATGLPVYETGTFTAAGVAWRDGYMWEIERARLNGSLAASSVRGKVRTRQAAMAEFLAGKGGEVERGQPPRLSPSGRYRVEIVRPAWDKNPIQFTYECQVVDTQSAPGTRPMGIEFDVEEKGRIRFLFADSETTLFAYSQSRLTLYDIPHRCAIADFERVDLPVLSPVPGGR
jgi:hypothetical protein